MTWEIFLGIVALVGFLITVVTPLIKLTRIMTELSLSVDSLKEAIKSMGDHNKESHAKIWAHNEEQDKMLENHNRRITKIECKLEINNKEEE